MSDLPENTVVYLEDIAPAIKPPAKAASTAPKASEGAKAGEKRQRGLFEFGVKRRKTNDGVERPSSSSSSTSLTKLNSIPFSLADFVNSLSDEQRELLKLECSTLSPVWLKMLKDELRKPYFLALKRFLRDQGIKDVLDPEPQQGLKVYPPAPDIYSWSRHTPLGRVKVVIIGQDPYPGPKQAHGLCFSVRRGVTVPPSLVNIYSETKAEYSDFVIPKHGNLEGWAKQGVLMLNSALTVEPGKAHSHNGKGWEKFTEAVLALVDRYGGANLRDADGQATGTGRGVVFMAWGADAQKCIANLKPNRTKHLVLTSAHPSPLSCYRGFSGNGHFLKANAWLQDRYGPEGPVDWCKLDEEAASTSSTTASTSVAVPPALSSTSLDD
ncbi:uracil-DNA glycosylase [Auricularia subglabra TFB-10046 SS5]|nr:uracil-DNA glycosylase [Auricularia subglabra TFB-10046 SS5]